MLKNRVHNRDQELCLYNCSGKFWLTTVRVMKGHNSKSYNINSTEITILLMEQCIIRIFTVLATVTYKVSSHTVTQECCHLYKIYLETDLFFKFLWFFMLHFIFFGATMFIFICKISLKKIVKCREERLRTKFKNSNKAVSLNGAQVNKTNLCRIQPKSHQLFIYLNIIIYF